MQNQLEENTEIECIEPRKFKVILLNDDYTSMDFVVDILISIFDKNLDEAVNIMLKVHREGRGICGLYPYDIAETKVLQVRTMAKNEGYPLRAIIEEE